MRIFAVTGAVNTTGSATTDANGEATFCYPGPAHSSGTDAITAFADTDNTHKTRAKCAIGPQLLARARQEQCAL